MSSTSSGYTRITRDHAAAIGYVVTNWGLVEARLAQTIGILLGTNSMPTHAITAERSSADRMQMIFTLLRLAGNEVWLVRWQRLAAELETLRTQRNDIVHAEWRGTEYALMPNVATRVKARGRVKIELHIPSTKQVGDLSEAIAAVADRLAAFEAKLFNGGAAAMIGATIPTGADPSRWNTQGGTKPQTLRKPKSARISKSEEKKLRKAKVAAALKRNKPAS